jgi:tagatose-1,6-bisphosphate aldolase non-catalytic subunit AgaZ/GatZ
MMARQKALIYGTETPWPAGQTTATISSLAVGEADTIAGAVFSDQPGTLFVEQSGEGTNWDVSSSFTVIATQGVGFKVDALLAYARVRFVPTATNPSAFRLFVRTLSAGTQM